MIEITIINSRLSTIENVQAKALPFVLQFDATFLDSVITHTNSEGEVYYRNFVDGTIEDAESLYTELSNAKCPCKIAIMMQLDSLSSRSFWTAMKHWGEDCKMRSPLLKL